MRPSLAMKGAPLAMKVASDEGRFNAPRQSAQSDGVMSAKSHILKRIKTRIECETARGLDGKRYFPSTSSMAAGGCEQAGCAGRIGPGTRLSCFD